MSGADGVPSAGSEASSFVPNQLSALVPSFDPSKDDLQVYTQKVGLLVEAWPAGKYTELVTRLILNCSGSAFLKLQLHQKELLENDRKSVKRLVELLGGHWGQLGLEKRYEYAERALYKCTQKADETADSFLARADIMWTELNSRELKLSDLQAYVTLRGSTLSSEDKKRVLVDADAAGSGELSVQKVSSAIRMLGAGFFQDVTGMKRTKLKTYDQATLATEAICDDDDGNPEIYAAEGEMECEDEMFEILLSEGDTDATFISDFENAASEVIQGDEELAAAYNTYTEARKRLSEKVRFRGFWPVSQGGKAKGHSKGRVKGKFQKGHSSSRKSLEQRILTSRCRICNKVGHWKAECPEKPRSAQSSAAAPTSFVSSDAALPMEFLHIPEDRSGPIDEPQVEASFLSFTGSQDFKGKLRVSLNNVWERNPKFKFQRSSKPRIEPTCEGAVEPLSESHALFATHGSLGVVDLGATKTVIGSELVVDLIQSLHPSIRSQLSRCPCHVTFRFGNHGTLKSTQALVVPLQDMLLKIAIVPGSTPFLISNTLLRAFHAVIDVEKHVMWSKKFHREFPLQLTPKGLFLVDLNDLAALPADASATQPHAETHMAEISLPKSKSVSTAGGIQDEVCFQGDKVVSQVSMHEHDMKANMPMRTSETSEPKSSPSVQPVSAQVPCDLPERASPDGSCAHDVVAGPSSEDPSSEGRRPPRSQSVLIGTTERDEGGFRQQVSWTQVPRSVGDRSTMDQLVSQTLSGQHQGLPSSDDSLHRAQDRARRARGKCSDRDRATASAFQDLCTQGEWEAIDPKLDSEAQSHASQRDAGLSGARRTVRVGLGRDGTGDADRSSSRCLTSGAAHAAHGECHPDHLAGRRAAVSEPGFSESCRDHRTVDLETAEMLGFLAAGETWSDNQHVDHLTTHSCAERQKFRQLVELYSQELDSCIRESKPTCGNRGRLTLLEVFCGPESRLTHQVQQLGFQAQRLGLAQCDLQSREGRLLLFQTLLSKNPEHVWFSPSCGPWSGWSTLNGSRSLQSWDKLQQLRLQHLEQIALGIVIMRYQRSCHRHMHWEQSRASLMFKLPYLQEVHQVTQATDFDMCTAGSLQDPESGKFIKKGMTVLSTSNRVAESLRNKKCCGNHEHQVIEGSTVAHGMRMNRSTFSESYPRKFARDMAKVLCKITFPREKPCDPVMFLSESPTLVNEPALKRRRLVMTAKPKLSRSTEMTSSMQVKRRKLNGKQSPLNALDAWTKVFDLVDPLLARVGKRTIDDSTVLQNIQELLPDKQVKFVIACRGSNRTIAPTEDVVASEAPFRKCVYLKRGTTQIFVEDEWENWEQLSKRQKVRPSHACRINITVFAANSVESREPATVEMPVPAVASPSTLPENVPVHSDEPGRVDHEHTEESISPSANLTPPKLNNNLHDDNFPKTEDNLEYSKTAISSKHESHESIKGLSKEDQNILNKIHKNLGHPSAERMSTIMLQQGYRPEMVKAARNFRCDICTQNSMPKHARPSSLRDDLDFNDRISIDGLVWTNIHGKTFHMYHVLDWGTNFHMATIAPSKSTEDVIQAMLTMWLSWAGIPGELLVDAASELNSEGFMHFLQSHNIRATTISPEAHFQNGRSERHGAILQHMLTKFNAEHPIDSYADLVVHPSQECQ